LWQNTRPTTLLLQPTGWRIRGGIAPPGGSNRATTAFLLQPGGDRLEEELLLQEGSNRTTAIRFAG
ncbi:hypothetical protein, partial [Nitrosomonas europaea]|uniref:hypothetical protein n=1 Tax=Nitrosomonas europaea TaxID=915 RepID=UPI002C4E6EC7